MSTNKILFLGTSDKGGVSIYVSNLIKDMKSVSFFIPRKNNSSHQVMSELYPNAHIFKFDQNYTFLTLYARAKELDRIIKKYKIDIIHAHVLRFGLLAAVYKKYFNKNIKLIYTGHGSRYTQKEKKYEQCIFKNLEKFVNTVSNNVIFIRELEYKNSLKNNLINAEKAHMIKTQIQLSRQNQNKFSIRSEYDINTDKIIAMIGSVYDIKNPFLFCNIAREVLKKRDDVTFLWVGDGPMLAQMQNYVVDVGLEDKIKFIGAVEYQNMKATWNEIDVLLLTSKIETFPLIIVEAYQSQTLVLSTNFSGVNEVVRDGFTGYVFDMNNKDDAVDKLENLFTYDQTVQIIKENALNYYNDHLSDVNTMANKHIKIYKVLKNDNS